MCTTIKYKNCVGRNFDYETSYKETPRRYDKEKYNIVGMVTDIIKEYPLYYDAMNEHGLVMCGLNFEGNAIYNKNKKDKKNIPSWDLIIRVLGNCRTINDVKRYLDNVNITNTPYNDDLPTSELHWFIADKDKSLVLEQTKDGLNWYENEFDVMTNNPPFDAMKKLVKKESKFKNKIRGLYNKLMPREAVTRGTETLGIEGDLTSIGRFRRAYFYKQKMLNCKDKFYGKIETFHLLDIVKQPYGATPVNDKYEYTIYEVVYDMENLIMYIKKYDDLKYEFYVVD